VTKKIVRKTWISPKAEVRESKLEGKGLFAKKDIKAGEKVVVFGGNYTDKQGADKARKLGKLIMQWDEDLYSFEDRGDNASYFINHSCDSNLWMADAFTLIARRDIRQGEEITADYALWEADKNFVSCWNCNCGAKFCRGKVTGKDWQDPALQSRYKDHFSPLINRRTA